MRDHANETEWQDAVDAAHGALALDAEGGAEVNVARCEEIIERGAVLGIQPSADAVERFVASL